MSVDERIEVQNENEHTLQEECEPKEEQLASVSHESDQGESQCGAQNEVALCEGDNPISDSAPDVSTDSAPTPCEADNPSSDSTGFKQGAYKELEMELQRERSARILAEQRLVCIGALEARGLPLSFCDFLVGESDAQTLERVEELSGVIKSTVNCEIAKRLESIATPRGARKEMTREQFSSLSLSDMQRLYYTDRELYKELTRKN